MVSILYPAIVLVSRKSFKLSEQISQNIQNYLILRRLKLESQAKTRFVWQNQEANQSCVIPLYKNMQG
jgi:hypothetical protein